MTDGRVDQPGEEQARRARGLTRLPIQRSKTDMQIHNESGSEQGAEVVGNRLPARMGEPTSAPYADSRRAGLARNDGCRLSPEREAQIRQRVIDGSYNSLRFVDEVARRIIRSADL
jgi:hypothetical protein